jgi:hypothetical protein
MRPWEIRLFAFTSEGPHPAVIISNEERCQNPDLDFVNALICASVRLNRGPKDNEVILDESDGLDWKTAVRCDVIHLVRKDGFRDEGGLVSPLRRKLIVRKIIQCLRLPL